MRLLFYCTADSSDLHGCIYPTDHCSREERNLATSCVLSTTHEDVAMLPQVVHLRDLLVASPYTNTPSVLEITGTVLRQAMERSAEDFTQNDDGTLRVSDCFLEPKVEHYNYDYYMGISYT